MADNVLDVQKLYVSYFSRPADPGGLQYWTNALTTNPGALQELSRQFSLSQEYRDNFAGMDNRGIVSEVYQNLFGREAEAAGVNYWADLLDRNAISIDNVVTNIAAGAAGNDRVAFNGKVAVATQFTERLDQPNEVTAYAGDAANDLAVEFLATVKDLTSAATAMDPGVVDSWIARIVTAHGTGFEGAALIGVQTETYSAPVF